ncbi:isthmin-2-like [Scleropages formosus]|uniref:Isthmin-2-like n=1 Tax=Scleropages formosus TaxID=113540 RepID=A0A0P7WEQ5_SCLFO|nr:isthmin-2-like [Scleropages formosus]
MVYFKQVSSQTASKNLSHVLEVLQPNQVQQNDRSTLRHRRRRWSSHVSGGALNRPTPEQETKPFVFDLKNFPDLANADLSSLNPNIQVTIEVVESPQTEMEMDLAKEGRSDWSLSTLDWLGNRKLFWPLFWKYPDSEENEQSHGSLEDSSEDLGLEYDGEEPVPSGVGGEWDGRWNQGWDSTDEYEYEEQEWSSWSPCSITCGSGNQKRMRSCGYACTATETRTCDLKHCPGNIFCYAHEVSVVGRRQEPPDTRVGASEKTSVTLGRGARGRIFAPLVKPAHPSVSVLSVFTDVDSCEQWLSCKNDFLQKYLHQVLTELPGCPCRYPSEVVYSAVSIFDDKLRRSFRWRDASGPKEQLAVYKATARVCVRSMLSLDSSTLASQHCCYDQSMQLLTRGSGAGTPDLISADFSPELHHKVDVLPWVLCKGDWSRFHAARPPNNGLRCAENPPEEAYVRQLEEAREY